MLSDDVFSRLKELNEKSSGIICLCPNEVGESGVWDVIDSTNQCYESIGRGPTPIDAINDAFKKLAPEPQKYIPYTDADRDVVRGKWIKSKHSGNEFLIDSFACGSARTWSWVVLFDDFLFLDGSIVGKQQ